MPEYRHLAQIFSNNASIHSGRKAIQFKRDGQIQSLSWSEVWTKVLQVASLFNRIGLQPNMKVAISSANCLEWLCSDIAALTLGAVTVPIYPTLAGPEMSYILSDSGSRILVVQDEQMLGRLDKHWSELDQVWAIVLLHGDPRLCHTKIPKKVFSIQEAWNESIVDIAPIINAKLAQDAFKNTATIIYTSGTTGFPKGVMLTHENFLKNCEWVLGALPLTSADVHLSFLPLSHVFERMCGYYLMAMAGAQICYAESIDKAAENAKEFKPTFLLGVPRFYEKIHAKIMDRAESARGLKKRMFDWALEVGALRAACLKSRASIPLGLQIQCALAESLVYKKIKANFGGRVRFFVSGGAALVPNIAEFFLKIGLLIVEGYGLTETSPVIAFNRVDHFKFGTVGLPLKEIQVRISDEGEILTKSACVMTGYYHKPDETAGALRDGWFHTGDMGEIDNDGFLKITGRIKELIVLSGGKKVSPQRIEEYFEECEYIQRCVLYGEGKNFLTAFIVPDLDNLKKNSEFNGANAEAIIQQSINRIHARLANFQQIKYFKILPKDFSLEEGELTPTLKIKRSVVCKKYGPLLEPFYKK
jgi:long-chain acyl-CoA synthetase